MKIKFVKTAPGRPEYSIGETYEFNGPIEEGYAKKYLERGWAVPTDKDGKEHLEKRAAEAEAAAIVDAKEKAEYKAKVEAGERGPKKAATKK